MSNDSGGSQYWRCAVCAETIPNVAANSLPSCPFCQRVQPGYPIKPNPSQSPGASASARSPSGSQVPSSDRSASGTQGDSGRLKEGHQTSKQEVLRGAQQPMQGVQPIQETRGPQQPRPVVLSREQQQLLHYQQQLTENQRMYNELKQKYDQQANWLGSMESNFRGQNLREDQFQQLMGQKMLCQQLWNDLQTILKQQDELWHQFIMLGGVNECQELIKYEQQLIGIEGQLKQQLDQALHLFRHMQLSSGGPQFGPNQQQQLLGQRAFCQQLETDLQIVLKRQQEFRQKFMVRGESAPQGSSQVQRTVLQGGRWVPVPEGPDQQQQHQQGMQAKTILQGGQWVPMQMPVVSDQQQQQGQPPPQHVLQGADNAQRSGGARGQQQEDEQRRLQLKQQRVEEQRRLQLEQQRDEEQRRLQLEQQRDEQRQLQLEQQRVEGQQRLQLEQQREEEQRRLKLEQQRVEEQRRLQLEQQRVEEQRRLQLEQQREEEEQRLQLEQQREKEQRRLMLEQQQQKERELLQQKHSVDAQRKEVKEKHEEIKEERMEIEGEGVQLKKQEMSQQQQQRENVEQLHKHQEMITKQKQMPQDPGEHDQQPRDKQQEIMDQLRNLREKLKVMMQQQQQQLQGEGGDQQTQQKQIEQEIQMIHQQIRSLELQMLQQQGEDDQQNQHQQQSGVQTPHREAEGISQQPGNSQQEQENQMLEQQKETQLGPQKPTDGQTGGEYDDLRRMWERVSKEQDELQQEKILQRHRQQLEQRQRREGQLKEDERREPSQTERQDDHSDGTDVCGCGTPFRPNARICANPKCGKGRRKNQPQGPPCVHCGIPLIKEGALRCGSCNKKQSEAPTKPAKGAIPLPPPPGLGQGYGYPNPPQQQPGAVQPPSSAMVVPSTSTLPHTSQSAMVFGKTASITTSVRLYQPIQVHSEENKNLSAAGDKPSAMMPPDAEQQQESSTSNPQGSPATGVSGALPSNQGSDGGDNQPIVKQPQGVPDSARSTKASGQSSHPLSAEDAAAQSQAAASTNQKQTDSLDANHNVTAGPDAGGDTSTTASASDFPEPQSTTQTGSDTVNHPLAVDDHASGEDPNDEKSEKSREESGQGKSYAAVAATNNKDQTVAYVKPKEAPVYLPPKKRGDSKKLEDKPSEPKPKVCFDGLKTSPEKSVKLTFHVLVPKACWEWDSKTVMQIRFGHLELGPWSDCGTFKEIRDYGGGVVEMACTFETFNTEILKIPLPYKYVIHSPKEKKPQDCYEYLHAHSSHWYEYNRCLVIPAKDRHFPTGEYHKYDCIAYPKSKKISKSVKDYAKGFVSFVSGGLFFGKSKDADEIPESFTPLGHQAMSEVCLDCYLTRIKEMLCSGMFPDGYDINSIATEISFIYESLRVECVSSINYHIAPVFSEEKHIYAPTLNKRLQLWFESIIEFLSKNCDMNPIKRLVCALCIAHCIKMPSISVLYKIQDAEKYLLPLASMLALHPDGDVKAEYEQVCSHIPVEHRPTVANAISRLCSRVAIITKKFTIEWLLAIPLCHFLENESEPYGKVKLDRKLDWELYNTKFGMANVTIKEKNFVSTYYDRVKDYFAIDPLLLKLFAYLVPKTEFTALCEKVPPYLSVEILINRALLPIHPNEELWIWDIEQVKLACVHHTCTTHQYSEPEYLSAMVKSSFRLCSKLSEKLRSREENQVKVLRSAFSCVLCAIEKACTLREEEHGKAVPDKTITKIRNLLKDWIVDQKVIGGSVFGHTVPRETYSVPYFTRSQPNWKGKEELKVWQCLLSLELPRESHILTDWQNIIGGLVKDRIYCVTSEKLKIDLVIEMEKLDKVHPVLEGIIMDAALKAVDTLFIKGQNRGSFDIESLAKQQSERVGKLLGKIFDKHYPNLEHEPTLDDLFGWNHWPRFISICESQSKLKQGLSKNCIMACSYAKETVSALCERAHGGQVSVNELEVICINLNQITELFQACLKLPNERGKRLAVTALESVVKDRKEEYDTFVYYQSLLKYLCRYIAIKVSGIKDLSHEVDMDYGEVNLNDICTRDAETKRVQLVCFKSAGSLLEFVENFNVLSQKHGSELFSTFWREAMTIAIRDNPDLTLDSVHPMVWQPCLDKCKQLLTSLSDLSMKLVDVDLIFRDHRENIYPPLYALFKGLSLCIREKFNWTQIEKAIKKIKQYWDLCRYRKGANIFLGIRDSLGLKGGDFSLVEKLSKELATSGGNQTLTDVNESLVQAGVFLEDIAKNPRKVDCLGTFVKCKDIVMWLQKETKDVNEIQHFVNVALATAAGGEGDLSHDKLSGLRIVGSGFASLIYDFPKDAGFTELKKACTYVWDALEKKPNLPQLLENCNKDIEWYQSVKDTQGSVEVTSYGQMRNILKFGRYQVGVTIQSKPVHTIHDLISLKLIVKDKKLSKISYNLDDLRDLESKLVLITGSKAENRTQVDHYLNVLQYVTRIAEVLLALRQAGNVAYSGDVVVINCAMYVANQEEEEQELQEKLAEEHVAVLNALAKQMESALEGWENEVKESRKQFYALNYYTTRQLLKIRKELGLFRQSPHRQISPEVLAMLQSISPAVTSENVHSVLTDLEKLSSDLQTAASSISRRMYDDKMETLSQRSDVEVSPMKAIPPGATASDPKSSPPPSASGNEKLQAAEQALTNIQKEILTNLVEYQGYSRLLVLKAFEECDEEANEYDIQCWCGENENVDFDSDDEEDAEANDTAESSDESSSSGSDFSDEEEDDSKAPLQQYQSPKADFGKDESSSAATGPKVKVICRQIINESHPAVQQLVEEFEYDLEASIEAVRLCGNVNKAMDYLARKDTDEGEDIIAEFDATLNDLEELNEDENIIIYSDKEAEGKYLTLNQLGSVLGKLSKELPEWVNKQRKFNDELKDTSPNLIVAHPNDVLRTVLTLYMENEDLPLPTLDEVLICNQATTAEEINLLWRRALDDPGFMRIFCLVHAEKLSYQTCDKVVETLKTLSQAKQGYRLVIICSKEGEDKSHIVSKLLLYKRSIILREKCRNYLRRHLIQAGASTQSDIVNASIVDHEKSCVRVVSSSRTGMGKSLFIQRMANQLGVVTSDPTKSTPVVIPIHGPVATADVILDFLKDHYREEKCKIYHFDIAPSILYEVDTILFSLLILRGLMDSQGRVWRCNFSQLYAVEVTKPVEKGAEDKTLPEARTLDLLNLLPTVECLSPEKSKNAKALGPSKIGMDDEEFHGATFQRVYQYLRRHAAKMNLDHFQYQATTEGSPHDCLQLFLQNCGVEDPTWSEVHHFAKFLSLQLEACEESVFCQEVFVGDTMPGFKGFVVKFMISMSRDFATPSLRGEVAKDTQQDQLVQYEIEQRKRWEESAHPYIFFNNDIMSVTFVGFIITENGDMTFPRAEPRIMTPQLYKGLIRQRVNFSEDYRQWDKNTMVEKLSRVLGIEDFKDPDDTYVLTIDNLIKILAIQMRFRCGIPVVIMGETGCGKTRLIRYMCDLARKGQEARNMLILKIHGGTKESDITEFIAVAEKQAKINKGKNMDTVVFFDEANTTDAIGLIKEIMCDRRLHGKPVSTDLKFIAACNPYRRHSEKMIKRLEAAGLGFYVRATETQQRLGKIPLRQLVYRVLDLPPSMRPLIYDFGQLKKGTEDDYIGQIVHDHVKKHSGLRSENPAIVTVITGVLAASQAYMREKKDECSFVSLRDVERAMIVFEHFYEHIDDFRQADQKQDTSAHQHPSNTTSALILAVSVCYHARLQERKEYEDRVSAKFVAPLALSGGAAQFRNEIIWCQNVLLDNMELGQNIAKNAALRENVFMMAICVELRIPLFLVGKPGSSKSLAKSIIQDSMHGKTSHSDLLKKFKQVHMFSYQCSQLATPESVIEVFKSAKRFQSKQDTKSYVAVVVLDEVGLAEDSPNLPLKALHPLLEDGTEGAGAEGKDEVIERGLRVAFIGISNWALDPAKMNRGVMVTRGTPDIKELQFSAEGICGEEENDRTREKLEPYFKDLAKAYEAICKRQVKEKEFFGLRDFYSLIKMLYWMCKKSGGLPLTWPQMKHAIKRNFGGLKSKDWDPFDEFEKRLNLPTKELNREDYDENIWQLINPDCSRFGLIKTSLDTKETSFHGENRYLLFLTENYAALDILEHYIRGKKQERAADPEEKEEEDAAAAPFTLFGSSFPKDKDYTQVCRNINQIKICMETGRTVILLNLENLYESLYDVLNQYYMRYGENRYVDLGLQTHRVKCRVHNDFKLILIAERETVYEKFPTPLINRLEKHFVLTSSVLKDWQQIVLIDFEKWIGDFSGVRGVNGNGDFKEGHAFIGYQKDTPAAVVFQASRQLKRLRKGDYRRLESMQEYSIFRHISLEELAKEEKGSDLWKLAVLRLSQYLLLQIASDDALIRLKRTALVDQQKEFMQIYFSEQHHDSIINFVCHHIKDGISDGLLMQVTTHGHLLQREELEKVEKSVHMKVEAFLLQEFDTELDFSNKVGPLFLRQDETDTANRLLVIQCDSGHKNGNLIACARYRIYDERIKAINKNKLQNRVGVTHVLFIINLPHQVSSSSSFVGFQGDPWISCHIDDLRPTSGNTIEPQQAISANISDLFIGGYINDILPLLDAVYEVPSTPENELESEKESKKESDIDSSSGESDSDRFESGEHTEDEQKPNLEGAESVRSTGDMEVVDIEQTQDAEFVAADRSEDTSKVLGDTEHSAQENDADDLNTQIPPDSIDMHLYSEDDSENPPGAQIEPTSIDEIADSVGLEGDVSLSEAPKLKRVTIDQYPIAQCQRLYGCIQAAASRLEDATNLKMKDRSTQRVSRLTKLIPRDPVEHIERTSFYGTLVMHLYKLLKEREEDTSDLSEWVLSEALSASKLEVGGTFRNVLARKIDEVVIPLFAKVIACIDCNYNLDLIDPKAQDSARSRFWLAMFGEPKVLQLKYSETAQGDTVPGVGGRKSNQDFKCQMPFFWLIRDTVDSQWDIAKSGAGLSKEAHHVHLCEFILATPIGVILESVDEENCEEFYRCYLHDFVRSVHKCNHRKAEHDSKEYQLVSDALDHMVMCSEFQHDKLISRIAALHIVHWNNKSQILCFGQLVSHTPSIMDKLVGVLPSHDFPEMELHLNAALKVMSLREPPLQKDNPNPNLTQWLNHIRLSRNAIESILELKSSSGLVLKARQRWQRLHATQLFVEHVMLKHPTVDMKLTGRRLAGLWKGNSDFLKVDTVKSVQLQLNSMEKKLKDEDVNKDKIRAIKKSGREFFMEVVFELCFGGRAAPEPALIKMLLNMVFVEKTDSTQELTPYKNAKADKIPIIRSFLLQLLLEHSMDQVRDHLKEYLDRSCRVVSGNQATIDENLYLLIIQCLEDSLAKRFSHHCLADKACEATTILQEGFCALQEHQQGPPTLEYLEGVAKARFSLSVVAEVLKGEEIGQHFMKLLKAAGQMCTDREVNCIDPAEQENTMGPLIYLLKLIVRQYGMPCLRVAAQVHDWLVPAQLMSEEDKLIDPFILYGGTYKKLRESMSEAMNEEEIEELVEATENLKPQEVVHFLLAIYEKVTLSQASTDPVKEIGGDALEKLDELVEDHKLLSDELRSTAKALLANELGGKDLEQMTVSPQQPLQCRTILGVVVHTATVFFGQQKLAILLPFVNILNNPAALIHSYLPTMPEDHTVQIQATKDPTGQFYECPRGHKYFVGNVQYGKSVPVGVCKVCHAPIGGAKSNLQQGNKVASLQDTTKMGHDLGAPRNRTHVSPERDLSARSVCILRALMHSAFVWASCNNDQALGAIAELVHAPQVTPQQLPEFFWAHLEKDLELLGKDTKKGLEENVMILHLVLEKILTLSQPTDGAIQTVNTLATRDARQAWERIFSQHYIQPVLTYLDENLATAMDLVANDDQQDHDQLFFLVYEKVKYTKDNLEPHLWTYRSRITLEHLRQSFHDKKLMETYPILYEFLQAEADLRATKYLPEIARLQQCLYDKFNRQVDKRDSKQQTIAMFIEELPNETTKNEYREMISELKAAWSLVGHKLKNHRRLPLEEKYYIPTIDDETTKMEYLVPTTSEAGVCTTALVDFLTLTHNNFIKKCRELVDKDDQNIHSFWREHNIPITHLHRCHLLDYEHQLPSIILSHCHYSLKVGKGQDVKYDHLALEKHILNRFIHGKPLILLDIPQVVYKKDIYTTGTFAEVRKKVAPQETLPQRVRQDIVTELHTPDRLREALDVVEIVLGFLSSGGGRADKPLGDYIDKTLKMKKRNFSQKAKMACQLKHTLSLWETIAVELARQLCLRGQEPFESMHKDFLRVLLMDEDGEDQFAALDRCLGQFEPDLLLGTLYEFIETHVKHSPQQERGQSLVKALTPILDRYGVDLPLSEFPASIKLDQAVAAWKHIVHYYDTNRHP